MLAFYLTQGPNSSTIGQTTSSSISASAGTPGPSSSGNATIKQPLSATDLISSHAYRILDQSSEFMVNIDRSSPEAFWMAVVAFYKGGRGNLSKLKQSLVVNFVNTGECGADCGALRKEFFEDALQEANERLFEGEVNSRIPMKDASLELQLEVAGMLIGHSLLQGGPGMPCLSPAVFQYLVHGDVSLCYPAAEEIPLNIATHDLITFIDKVSWLCHMLTCCTIKLPLVQVIAVGSLYSLMCPLTSIRMFNRRITMI